ncbi:MAG: type I glyceraldehyde-3-phosphate dehydrogenase [Candidatus Woesearchaeota archaeon]
MMVRIAINGFGRIGRMVYRIASKKKNIDIIAINDLTDTEMLAYLLKHDSVHGTLKEDVEYGDDHLKIGGRLVHVYNKRDPEDLPWKDLNIDVVIESTGLFRKRKDAAKHLKAGAKKVIISAPSKDADLSVVLGVNHTLYDKNKHDVISNASCTTNSLAPVVKVLNDVFGIKKGLLTTVHSATNSQNILDGPHKKKRRSRSAMTSIIPTTTGAAEAVTTVIPELKGKLDGMAMRVPTPNGSVSDFVVELDHNVTKEELNFALKKASENELKGILGYTEEELVSSDIIGNPHSSIVDSKSTKVIDNMAKIIAWYDNEWGYSNRTVDLIEYIMK